jgi:hypothetical protein
MPRGEHFKVKTTISLILAFLFLSVSASAQSTSATFPQFADGKFPDGSYYRSTVMFTSGSENDTAFCIFRLYGMTATLGPVTGDTFPLLIPTPGGFFSNRTNGTQALQTGYATLDCDKAVFSQVLYAYYAANGTKLSEATVFPSAPSSSFRVIVDYKEGARLALAIANNTDLAHSYTVYIGLRQNVLVIPAHRSMAQFLDEILLGVLPNELTQVRIKSNDLSDFSVIGFRYTGAAFSTILAN